MLTRKIGGERNRVSGGNSCRKEGIKSGNNPKTGKSDPAAAGRITSHLTPPSIFKVHRDKRSLMTPLSLVSLGVLVALLLGSPVSATYSLDAAKKYMHFSGAAYCADPRFKTEQISDWSCKACKDYPGMEATPFSSKKECNGFVGYYPTDNEIVVSFSGTDPLNIQMWIDDLDFLKTSYPYCSGCEVHEGFYKTYLSAADTIRNLTATYVSQHPSAAVTCTGHSLGAALAAHCAADLNDIYKSSVSMTSSYTFGTPRVGDETYSTWYKSSALPFDTFRTVHRKDPVPHLPTQNMGFHHFPYEVFYKNDYNDYKVCSEDGEDKSCSDQYALDADILNHLEYVGFDVITNFMNCEL